MAYDSKFRKRVIAYKDSGHSFTEVERSAEKPDVFYETLFRPLRYEAFGVTARSYYKWKEQLETNGKFVYGYHKEHKGKISPERLKELLEKHPDWYFREFAEALGVCHQAVQKKLVRLGITRKKKLLHIRRNPKKNGGSTRNRSS
jgi:transposase